MTSAIDQQTLGRWHALQSALDLIAPLTNAAQAAVASTPATDRPYAQAKADTLAGLRDRLVASLRLAAPDMPAPPQAARKGQGAAR